ncbi:MAG: hypothetical protein HFF66_12095 [Oscillospiraceae bacterium]|nr:hypothetical protein [Oscillospiraceae bacterium]
MNYTKNYRLPQWVKEDRIMMDDFNAMNSSIENGLTKTAAQADTAVSTANTAKQTADSAHSIAQQITNAAYTPSNKPYTTGHYTGNGNTLTIELGFRPSFLIISALKETITTNDPGHFAQYLIATGGGIPLNNRCIFTNTGFTVYGFNRNGFNLPILNQEGYAYDYIAFK